MNVAASPAVDFSGFAALVDQAQNRSKQLISQAADTLAFHDQERRAKAAAQAAPGTAQTLASWGQAAPTADDNWSARGLGSHVPRSLIRTESGGNFGASNDVAAAGGTGHYGFLQFSPARLNEAIAAGVVSQMTPQEFLANEDAQIAAANWHFSDIDGFIQNQGLNQYIGHEIHGTPLTINSMRAVAHLGGQTGLMRYLESFGQYNPSDAFGTSLSDYARIHAGHLSSPSPQARPRG